MAMYGIGRIQEVAVGLARTAWKRLVGVSGEKSGRIGSNLVLPRLSFDFSIPPVPTIDIDRVSLLGIKHGLIDLTELARQGVLGDGLPHSDRFKNPDWAQRTKLGPMSSLDPEIQSAIREIFYLSHAARFEYGLFVIRIGDHVVVSAAHTSSSVEKITGAKALGSLKEVARRLRQILAEHPELSSRDIDLWYLHTHPESETFAIETSDDGKQIGTFLSGNDFVFFLDDPVAPEESEKPQLGRIRKWGLAVFRKHLGLNGKMTFRMAAVPVPLEEINDGDLPEKLLIDVYTVIYNGKQSSVV